MDALPPEPIAAHYAPATAIAPAADEERRLCARASETDWLYTVPLVGLTVGAVALDGAIKYDERPGVRTLGPAGVGFAWGSLVGGTYLAMPKCDPRFVAHPPLEGDVRRSIALPLSLALLAGATAPLLVGIETGVLPSDWTTAERATRLVIAGVAGFAGAFVPYLVPPRTYRAAKALEALRLGVTPASASISLSLSF